MNLKQIAMDALEEYNNSLVEEENDASNRGMDAETRGFERTDNGDGTVDLMFYFTLDPKVVAEKAKAMAKGVKRDDMSDDLGVDTDGDGDEEDVEVFADDTEDEVQNGKWADDEEDGVEEEDNDDDDVDPYNGVNTEDSASDTVFMDALDSVEGIAQDARANSRHAKTPLENCRAKDPRFCPYHGDKAWNEHVSNELKNKGLSGSVEVTGENGRYSVKVKGVDSKDENEVAKVIGECLKTKGVVNTGNYGTSSGAYSVPGSSDVVGKFKTDFGMLDKTGRLNEWVNDYMEDVVNDPNAEFDMNDFNALLEAQEDIDTFESGMNKQDPNDVKKYNDMIAKAESMYHSLVAQLYFKDVKTPKEAENKADEIDKGYGDKYSEAHKVKDDVDATKEAIFGKTLPRGFAKANTWADAYNKVSANQFHWRVSDYDKAYDDFDAAQKSGDMKAIRNALAALDYARESFENGIAKYETAANKFKQDLYDFASKDPKYQGKVAAAFPNGRPQ